MPCLSEYKQQNHPDPLAMAVEQLDVAIELFLGGRSYAAALTLAGAAEAVFANTLKRAGKNTALDDEFAQIDKSERDFPFFGIYPRSADVEKRRAAFFEFKYRGLNFAKHGPGREPEFRAYQRVEPPGLQILAEEAIERAWENAERLGIPPSDRVKNYGCWFQEQIG
jgi:hypothetical protein